jgi:hypothetical protein
MQWAASIKGLRAATTTTDGSLNRPLTVTSPFSNPDQSVGSQTTRTSYQGYTTTLTDPAGIVKQTTSDVFGHVTSVIEDVGHSNFQTNYFYDPLGDLTNVMKCAAGYSGTYCPNGQLRTFTYECAGRPA